MNADQHPKAYVYRRIVQAKLYMDNNYSKKIDLDRISDEAHFSKFHFIRLFKSIYGKTPHRYLTAIRIAKAQQLLQQGKTVGEVCFLVGYDSLSTFSGLFSKEAGKSPAQYANYFDLRKREIQSDPVSFVPKCYAFMHGWIENSNYEEVRT